MLVAGCTKTASKYDNTEQQQPIGFGMQEVGGEYRARPEMAFECRRLKDSIAHELSMRKRIQENISNPPKKTRNPNFR